MTCEIHGNEFMISCYELEGFECCACCGIKCDDSLLDKYLKENPFDPFIDTLTELIDIIKEDKKESYSKDEVLMRLNFLKRMYIGQKEKQGKTNA